MEPKTDRVVFFMVFILLYYSPIIACNRIFQV